MQNKQTPALSLGLTLHMHDPALIPRGDFVPVEDCLVTNVPRAWAWAQPCSWESLTLHPASTWAPGYGADSWIAWERPSPELLAKYSNVTNKGLNYFCSWKSAFTGSKTQIPAPLVLAPSPKPAESLKPQIWGLGRACEADLLGEIRLHSALCQTL